MRRLLTAIVVVLAVIMLYGVVRGDQRDRLRVSALVEKRLITLVVTMPDVSDRYRWLSVYGCSAEMTETGTYCTGQWEQESTREVFGYRQELFPWRDVPPGLMRVDAVAFDAQHRTLAAARLTVVRGE